MEDGSPTPFDANTGITQSEAVPQPVIIPREIEGLAHSFGRYGITAIRAGRVISDIGAAYLGEDGREFNFARPKIRDLTFRREQPRDSSSPALITSLHSESDDPKMRELFKRRATEHNAAEILQFLREGGRVEDLITTPFMPDIAQLQKMAQEAGPLQTQEPSTQAATSDSPRPDRATQGGVHSMDLVKQVMGRIAQEESSTPNPDIPVDPTTVRQLVLYGLTADAIKPGYKPFLSEKYSSITQVQREEFLNRLRTGQFYRRQFDDMMRLIPEADRQRYADQFNLLKKESGAREDVFENGNDLGDPSLEGPWIRNY